ncbi:MAG: glycosyltransferase, partial [Methylococcales bacterium]
MTQRAKPRILFVSESVTLAHFARPFELSNNLPEDDYEIHFACANIYQKFLANAKHTLHTIYSIPAEQFKQALASGNPLYNYSTLKKYVEEDLELIAKVKPDLIVGDFRISLAVSARLAKIPYATISNAYWSPYAPKQYPTPCLPMTKYLGVNIGGFLFSLAAPIAFKVHALAMQRLKKHFGLPKMELELRQVYTEADYTLYADIPSLFPLNNPPDNHFFIGPVLWSPVVTEPDWWDQLPADRPIIYVSMGSSGSNSTLQKVVNAFANERVTVIASVAGEKVSLPSVSNIFTADYIDGMAAAKRADLVICNGGSLSCQQAFAHGKPVLGIASNMDQFLNMAAVSRANAGLVLRADNI